MVEKIISGEKVYFFDEVDSTMSIANEFIKEGKKGIIVASIQKQGKGRYGRKWISEKGGLYFSIIEDLDCEFLSEIATVSLIETLMEFGINCKIKFPNDIIYRSKKISGILIEKKGNKYILGIGVNINNKIDKENIKGITLKEILKKEVNINEFLTKFLVNYNNIKKGFLVDKKNYLKKWGDYLLK